MRTNRRTPMRHNPLRAAALALVAVGLVIAAPAGARAEHAQLRGVTIDARGVHFDFGPGYHYLHVDYPRARHYFSRNEHFRAAKRLERERDELLHRARHLLLEGRYGQAERTFHKALRAETRRQRQLVRLDRDRLRFEERHRERHAAYRGRGRHRP